MSFPILAATILLANYDCGTYGSGDYSGACQTTSSNPTAGDISNSPTGTSTDSSNPSDSQTSSSPEHSKVSAGDNNTTTTTQPPTSDGDMSLGHIIESTPYAVLIPIALGIAILIGALFMLIRRLVRRS